MKYNIIFNANVLLYDLITYVKNCYMFTSHQGYNSSEMISPMPKLRKRKIIG